MTKVPTKPPKETEEQEEARRSQTSPPAPPKSTEGMVPMRSISVTVDEVAMRIFTRIYMDTAGLKTEHLANSAFDAAEKFIEVSRSRKIQNV